MTLLRLVICLVVSMITDRSGWSDKQPCVSGDIRSRRSNTTRTSGARGTRHAPSGKNGIVVAPPSDSS